MEVDTGRGRHRYIEVDTGSLLSLFGLISVANGWTCQDE